MSINKIRKTPTEIKQSALIRKHQKSLANKKPKIHKHKKSKKSDVELIEVLKKLSYREFLNTKYWKKVRGLVLKRDKFKCVICKSNDSLQVHHDTYKKHFKELDNLQDLMTLSGNCHKEHHYAQN